MKIKFSKETTLKILGDGIKPPLSDKEIENAIKGFWTLSIKEFGESELLNLATLANFDLLKNSLLELNDKLELILTFDEVKNAESAKHEKYLIKTEKEIRSKNIDENTVQEELSNKYEKYISKYKPISEDNCITFINFSNSGFTNSETQNLSTETTGIISGFSSQSLNLEKIYFAKVGADYSSVYKPLQVIINNKSIIAYLDEGHKELTDLYYKLYGKEVIEIIIEKLRSKKNVSDNYVSSLAKQVLIPYQDKYVAVSPMFNHLVMEATSEIMYQKDIMPSISKTGLGGANPINCSYFIATSQGIPRFDMSFPTFDKDYTGYAIRAINSEKINIKEFGKEFDKLLFLKEKMSGQKLKEKEIMIINDLLTKIDNIINIAIMNTDEITNEDFLNKMVNGSFTERKEYLLSLVIKNIQENDISKKFYDSLLSILKNEVIKYV